jgi:hypothetical protein
MLDDRASADRNLSALGPLRTLVGLHPINNGYRKQWVSQTMGIANNGYRKQWVSQTMGIARDPQFAQVQYLVTVIVVPGCGHPPILRVDGLRVGGLKLLAEVPGVIRFFGRCWLGFGIRVDDGFEFFVGAVTHGVS